MIIEKKREFIKEEPELYEAVVQHQYMTIDYDAVIEDVKKEYEEKGMQQGIQQGVRQGKEEGILTSVLSMIQIKYHEDASSWIKQCTLEQLEKITHLCFEDISYEEMKRKISK